VTGSGCQAFHAVVADADDLNPVGQVKLLAEAAVQ
jgi:hypothetical protein